MASFLNKVQDKIEATLDRNSNKSDNPHSSNAGPHSSNIVNKTDPMVDSDRDHRNDPTSRVGGYGNTQRHDQYGTTGGAGGFASSDTYGSSANNPGYNDPRSANAGPHSSNLLNKVDPRVDSDRDHRNDPTSRVGGTGNTQQYGDSYGQAGGAGGLGTSDTYGGTTGHTHTGHAGHTTHGHTGHVGHSGQAPVHDVTTSGYGDSHTTSSGFSGNSASYDNPQSVNAGPHKFGLANKLDPRVDSDRDNRNDPTSRVGGYGTQQDEYSQIHGNTANIGTAGGYGAGAAAGGYGPGHTSESYGSGYTTGSHGVGHGTSGSHGVGHNTGATGGYSDSSYTPGSGNAAGTAGPHNSNILNKLDPRVDSDMDGSKTYGGNQTHR